MTKTHTCNRQYDITLSASVTPPCKNIQQRVDTAFKKHLKVLNTVTIKSPRGIRLSVPPKDAKSASWKPAAFRASIQLFTSLRCFYQWLLFLVTVDGVALMPQLQKWSPINTHFRWFLQWVWSGLKSRPFNLRTCAVLTCVAQQLLHVVPSKSNQAYVVMQTHHMWQVHWNIHKEAACISIIGVLALSYQVVINQEDI